MKAIIATIAALGVMGSFSGSAIADVSFTIRFGSSPTYRSNIYQPAYPSVPYYQNRYERHHRRTNSSVIVREVYPSTPYYGNSWNYTVPQTVIQDTNSYSNVYKNRYNPYQRGYIRQKIR